MTTKPWWGEDVVPRIQWRIVLTGIQRWTGEGGVIPDGYGVAWRQPGRDGTVLMPVPINLIARALRECWFAIKCPHWGRADVIEFARERGRRDVRGALHDVIRLQNEIIYELRWQLAFARRQVGTFDSTGTEPQ